MRTRTRRWSVPCQDWGPSWAPGCSASSAMHQAGTPPPSVAKTTPERPPSRVLLAPGGAVRPRHARNKRLADAIYLWAFSALTASPGARAYYDQHRAAGDTHHQALRALGNRLVGIMHGCLTHHTPYDEHTAWAHRNTSLNTAA